MASKSSKIAENRKTDLWKSLHTIVVHAYPSGSINAITDRFYGAKCAWRNVAVITNSLGRVNHYKDQDSLIRAVLKAKGCPASSGTSGSTDNSSSSGVEDFSDESGNSDTSDSSDTSGSSDSSGSSSSSSSSKSSSNSMLTGDKTFKEIIGDLCNALDVMFLCKRNQILITDFESIYAEADLHRRKIPNLTEDIQLWQLQDGTYDHDVTEYGFFTVVYVHYNKGICKEYVPDLVNVYGEIPKHYYEKNLSRTQAETKAKTYLAAHMRDFEMGIKATILYNGGLDVGDIVTLENPLTLQNEIKKLDTHTENYYFLKGINIDWDEENVLKADIELSYAPEPPERGASDLIKYGHNGGESTTTDSTQFKGGEGATIDSIVKKICRNATTDLDKAKKIHNWLIGHIRYSRYECSHHSTAEACLKSKHLNCADTSRLTRAMMSSAGLDAEVVHGPEHFWTIITIDGQEYASDATSRMRKFNQVMRNLKYYDKCGDNPSC